MKKTILKYISLAIVITLALCQGDIGPVGPQGAKGPTGKNGADGTVGAQGSTGSTGATGVVGDKGATGLTGDLGKIEVAYVDWKNYTQFKLDSTPSYYTYAAEALLVDLKAVLPASSRITVSNGFANDSKFAVINEVTKDLIGTVYSFQKVVDNGVDLIFQEKYNTKNYELVVYDLTYNNEKSIISSNLVTYYVKSTTKKASIVPEVTSLNASTRYVFVPLSVSGRSAYLDPSNYKEFCKTLHIPE